MNQASKQALNANHSPAAKAERCLKPIALLTGATRGIGRAMAPMLARDGYHVLLCGRTAGGLEEIYDEICMDGGSATAVSIDLCDASMIEELCTMIAARWGRLDALISVAGRREPPAPAAHMQPKYWRETFAINVDAPAHLIRCMDPLLQEAARNPTPGASSRPVALFVSDRYGDAYAGAYGASKAALESLARSYATESARFADVYLARPLPTGTALKFGASPGVSADVLRSPAVSASFMMDLIRKRPVSSEGDAERLREDGDIAYDDR